MVLVGYNSFYETFTGLLGIKCVIRQFFASQDLIADMIFEWLEFLVEVQTKKTEKVPQKTEKTEKYRRKPKKTEKYRKKPNATANFRFFFGFFGLQPPYINSNRL